MARIMLSPIVVLLVLALGAMAFGVKVIVIPPIGAVPEGATLITTGLDGAMVNYLDSADAMCQRSIGSVNLFCRGMMLAGIAKVATIQARLPYSETLYYLTGAPQTDR